VRSWVSALGLALLACAPSASQKPPRFTPTGTLGLGDAKQTERERPFEVVEFGPTGTADASSELHIVFSRPLRSLELADAPAEPPVDVQPAIDGRWQWLGTQALCFAPRAGRLPGAQRYRVTVPATVRALDGSTLGRALRFEFTTPEPELVRSDPADEATGLGPDAAIALLFNQPIAPSELARVTTLRRADTHAGPVEIRVERRDPKDPKHLHVVPTRRLPVHARFELTLAAGLKSEEGPVASSKARVVRFETYGPLRAKVAECDRNAPHGRCYAPSGLALELSNPVPFASLKRAVAAPGLQLRWPSYAADDSNETYVSLENRFSPGARVTFEFGAQLRDIYGQTLGSTQRETLQFDDLWPDLEIGVSGQVLQPAAAERLSVGSVNVVRYELGVLPLTLEQAVAFERLDSDAERWAWFGRQQNRRARIVTPTQANNDLYKAWLDPVAALGAPGRGPLLVSADAGPGRDGMLREWKRLDVTELGVSAKLSRHGSVVWVTRLSDARPVADAEVELIPLAGNQPRRRYRTDAQGLSDIPASDFAPNLENTDSRALIVVRSGDDWTYRSSDDFLPPWRMSVPTDFSESTAFDGMLFSERGIYRPGDTAELKGIVRRRTVTGTSVPVNASFSVHVNTPEGQVSVTEKVRTSEFGTFAFPYRIPRSARLGRYSAELQGAGRSEITTGFEVAEFRPAEFAVDAASARAQWVRGERAGFTVHGGYLYGAPMAERAVHYRITRSTAEFAPPNGAGFVFDPVAFYADLEQEPMASGVLLEGSGKLDAQGNLPVTLELELPAQRSAERVTLDAEVTDLSRQSQSGSASALVHPAAFYVGLEDPDDSFVQAPGELTARVIALSPEGQRIAGREVKLELLRRRWALVREQTEAGTHSVTRPIDEAVDSCRVLSAPAASGCVLRVKQAGYHVVRASARDSQGRETQAASARYAIGDGQPFWRDGDDRTLKLTLDRATYAIGQTARLLVHSPFPEAEALVTVEREGVFTKRRLVLRGPTPTVDIPVEASFRPNAFVSVHLVRGGKQRADAPDAPSAPTYRFGSIELRVDPEQQRLRLVVTPSRSELEPGQRVTVDLAASDREARPQRAELTVFAVDEGVLGLTDYRTPDPLPVFTATRSLEVATLESRDSLARVALDRIRNALGLDKGREAGGGGGTGLSTVRRDFRPSAYYNASVVTDPSGHASVSFALPGTLTTYRVMALGVTANDLYGFGEARVAASKRLMVRPALPRFFRVGDAARASVIVSTQRAPSTVVHVRLAASGMRVLGDTERDVTVPADGAIEVPFSVQTEQAGTARLSFEARAEGLKDRVEVALPVRAPLGLEHVALHGATRDIAGERLGDLRRARSDVGELELSVAPTALVGIGAGMEQLIDYPYGCTEQLASRLLPLLPLRDLARSFSVALPRDLDVAVDKTLADIVRRQLPDGGFGLWPQSTASSPWGSAYALLVLGEAKKRGASVPTGVLDDGQGYLRRFLEGRTESSVDGATAAFMLDVLAGLGAPDPGYHERLFERRAKLPLFARALLLDALARANRSSAATRELLAEISGSVHLDGPLGRAVENLGDAYAELLDSPTRTSALVLRALLAADPDHALAEPLARGLLADRQDGVWRSTQEAGFSLLALDAFHRLRERDVPSFDARVWLGERELLSTGGRSTQARAQSLRVPMAALAAQRGGALVFEQRGQGTLYYDVRLSYVPSALPTSNLDRGFFVHKTLERVSASDLERGLVPAPERDTRTFAAGDLVLAEVAVVTASPRRFVVVEDPLPAGFEAIDAELATTAAWLRGPLDAACPDGNPECARSRAPEATELRDDRVLFFVDAMPTGIARYRYLARASSPGRFVLPATRAQQMYVPETFGRTAADVVEVR
jgi:alpha-2-macroglobulin